MAKPAKPETDAGKCARRSAKELLRKYGQAGTTAFRAVHNEPRAGGAAMAVQGGYGLAGYTPAPIGYPPPQGYPGMDSLWNIWAWVGVGLLDPKMSPHSEHQGQ